MMKTQQPPLSRSSEIKLIVDVQGNIQPRLSTPPLRELTPETSYGFAVIEFARDVLNEPLLEWQEKLVIRIGELLADGRPRFRTILILIARQNGKTHLVKVLSLFKLFIEGVRLIAGTSTNLKMAKEAWEKAIETAQNSEILAPLIKKIRQDNNDPHLLVDGGGKYMIAAANRSSLRGFTVDFLIVDELREHHNRDAWDAGTKTIQTKPFAQILAISNAGDDKSEVLNGLRKSALEYISSLKPGDDPASGTGDYRLGLFEWSADDDANPALATTWAQANPSMGRINPSTGHVVISPEDIQGDAIRAVNSGGTELTGFLTEVLCRHVSALDPAIDSAKWSECFDPDFTLVGIRPDAFCLDLNLSDSKPRATLVGTKVLPDGRARVWIEQEWIDANALAFLDSDVEAKLREHKPRVFTWLPIGPAASKASALKMLKVPGVTIQVLKGDVADACMGLADEVRDLKISHDNDPVLNDQLTAVSKKPVADRWVFTRQGFGDNDAAYATAGAVHAARTLPAGYGPPRLIGPDDEEED